MRVDSPVVARRCFPCLVLLGVAVVPPRAARADEPPRAHASARTDDWSRTDTVVEAGCLALLVADWRQTLDRRYTETNVVLGSHPDATKVTLYFVGVTFLQVLTARLLPRPWRTFFQGITIGAETRSVYNNWQLGAKLLW
jgi:hypothetical protein